MSTLLSRFAMRLLVPALGIAALSALGQPLESSPRFAAESQHTLIEAVEASQIELGLALHEEAEALREEADVAKKVARRAAAQMRWFLTLPAASVSRCTSPGCAS
jgi:hypothetical protein